MSGHARGPRSGELLEHHQHPKSDQAKERLRAAVARARGAPTRSARGKQRAARKTTRGRVARTRETLDAADGERRERPRERAPAPPEQQRRDRLVGVERIARAARVAAGPARAGRRAARPARRAGTCTPGTKAGSTYGSHITIRPPARSARVASAKNRRGSGRWWSTSNSTSAPSAASPNGSASALTSRSCQGARTTSVSSRSGMNWRAKPGPEPSSRRGPSAAGGSAAATRPYHSA